MTKSAIVKAVLEWIECHLDKPLSVENIAEHSGYGRRAFHDIFKSVTGHNIATYVRCRRLSQSATMLLLSNQSIAEIADQYQFKTVAHYTRAFKCYFNQTPAAFRKGHLDFSQHQFPHHETFNGNYILDIVQVPEQYVVGTSYDIKLKISDTQLYEEVARDCHAKVKREMMWAGIHHENIMAVISFSPMEEIMNANYLKIKYLIKGNNDALKKIYEAVVVESGKYAKITYVGSWSGYAKFPSKIYAYVMTNHRLVRRDGVDFEIFHIRDDYVDVIFCEYHIPIK